MSDQPVTYCTSGPTPDYLKALDALETLQVEMDKMITEYPWGSSSVAVALVALLHEAKARIAVHAEVAAYQQDDNELGYCWAMYVRGESRAIREEAMERIRSRMH